MNTLLSPFCGIRAVLVERLPSRVAMRLQWLSCGLFVGLYGVAAWVYPGGTRNDPQRLGFSIVHNYWCDLLTPMTYAGHANPARVAASAAMLVLSAGQALFWIRAPIHFRHGTNIPSPRTRKTRTWMRTGTSVRSCGLASSLLILLLGTNQHNWVVDAAGLFGMVAFSIACFSVRQSSRVLRSVSSLTAILVITDYLIWHTKVGLPALPLLQKVTFSAYLGWVLVFEQSPTAGAS